VGEGWGGGHQVRSRLASGEIPASHEMKIINDYVSKS